MGGGGQNKLGGGCLDRLLAAALTFDELLLSPPLLISSHVALGHTANNMYLQSTEIPFLYHSRLRLCEAVAAD
jgi:hypothetical protein